MTAIAKPFAPDDPVRHGPPITVDFLPRGPHYAQFVLRPLEPIRDATVTIRFVPLPIDGPTDIDRLGHYDLYERTFRKGYLGEPLTFTPPPMGPGDVGGMEVFELVAHYKALEVDVQSCGRVSATGIADLAGEWDALADAGILELVDAAQDAHDRDRRLLVKFEALFAEQVAAPLRENAHAMGSAVRQLIASQRGDYPYEDGDTIVIGPECFAAKDGSVISWKGENYVPQPPPDDEPAPA